MTKHNATTPSVLPARPRPWRELEQDLIRRQNADMAYAGGVFERYWPSPPSEVYLAAREAYSMFAYTNLFCKTELPALDSIESELRAMVSEVLCVPESGAVTLTSGGTESNFLALKAARKRARLAGHTGALNVVLPYTAHPSFEKAGDELGIDMRRADVGDDYRAVPALMAELIDDETIMLVGSAPSYPQGVVDPIEQIAAIAREAGVWMHVDACVGGFLIPFLRKVGGDLPKFSLECPDVWSVSADLHKFGFALNGISTFSVRDAELAALHKFDAPHKVWPFRHYSRAGFTGSRSGATIVAAWTTMQTLGQQGYCDIARRIGRAADRIVAGVAGIDGLTMMAPPEAGVVVIESHELDVTRIAAALIARGWDTAIGQWPPALHLLMSPLDDDQVDDFLEALAGAVKDVRAGAHATRDAEYGD